MEVSCLLCTDHLSEEGVASFFQVTQIVDELVAFVPAEREQPTLQRTLEKLGARIVRSSSSAYYPSGLERQRMMNACQGDWILVLDHDEELSSTWHDPRWRNLLRGSEFSHYFLPRYWLTDERHFLAAEPWWPDWQMRLLRNEPERVIFPKQLHERMHVTGQGGFLRRLALYHHDIRLTSRADREKKALHYERLRPGCGLSFYYLAEDYVGRFQAELPEPQAQAEEEIMRMNALTSSDIERVEISVESPPPKMKAGEICWITVVVTNNSGQTLLSGGPHPINLSYHWLEHPSRDVAVFEGRRTSLFDGIGERETSARKMLILPPFKPGVYLLQLTIVQEHLTWLESINSNLPKEFVVTVEGE